MEGMGAATAGATSTDTSPTTMGDQSGSSGETEGSSKENSASSSAHGGERTGDKNQNQKSDSKDGEDFEEIALGSTKGKVPKAIAKAIKDFERGAQSKFEESAKIRKQFQEQQKMLELFNENPSEFFKMHGKNAEEYAEELLAEKYRVMQMSPEQREAMELRKQVEQMKAHEVQSKQGVISEIKDLLGAEAPKDLEKYPKEELQAFLQHQQQEFQNQQQGLEKEFLEAWKESGLPKHKYFGSLMAFTMLNHQKATGGTLQANEAAAKVKGDFLRNVREVVQQMDPKGIQELLGQDVLTKLRQSDIERVTGQAPASLNHNRPASDAASGSPKKYLNQTEWRKVMGIG